MNDKEDFQVRSLTKEEAIKIAEKYNLEEEVIFAMQQGMTPEEALSEWDMFPYEPASDSPFLN